MDVEEVAQELYGLKPSEFIAARDAYVAQARTERDSSAAKAVAALRRPSLAAWAANQLARRRPEETRQFLALAETLREAHRTLDREQLREAGRRRNQLVGALARTAADLAREDGQPVSGTVRYEIEGILQAVLARPDTAALWSRGRLTKLPDGTVDFSAVAPQEMPARAASEAGRPAAARTEAPARTAAQRRELERARAEARDARALVRRREEELTAARARRTAAVERAEGAAEDVRRLEREMATARRTRTAAHAEAAEAGASVRAAERALSEGRRAAGRADRDVGWLEGGRGGR
ncbi:hypothetical protein ABZX40_03435 [Streptomyces sp. NPDC004610]|uniref:hypothetical protein n=1 Tax=unclassified Streptomyces TaxID=2593676 RepID=UPI0033AE0E7F